MSRPDGRVAAPTTGAEFQTTLWSAVLAAGREDPAREARLALEKLCQSYWRPLYTFLRRQGHNPHDAEDLTQGFLLFVLEHQTLSKVRREKGRFRSFLLAALKHYVSDQRDKAQAIKRGGGQNFISLDLQDEEGRYIAEPADRLDPEKLYDRRWALTLIDRVIARLAADYANRGKEKLYREIQGFLLDKKTADSHATVAARLGLKESTVGVEVHRLRDRFRDVCRREIADTVPALEQIDDEMRHLFQALQA